MRGMLRGGHMRMEKALVEDTAPRQKCQWRRKRMMMMMTTIIVVVVVVVVVVATCVIIHYASLMKFHSVFMLNR
jgi:heme/copper-type cytochrome/quinol oxidase subunit 2